MPTPPHGLQLSHLPTSTTGSAARCLWFLFSLLHASAAPGAELPTHSSATPESPSSESQTRGLTATPPVPSRPQNPGGNVLMIAIDDLRPMLGCYGHPFVQTPHIDRLAARSVVFDRAYCQYAKCGPSRVSLLTGLRPDSVGITGHGDTEVAAFRKRRPDAVSLPLWLKQHGYHSRSFGKIDHDGWHVRSEWSLPPHPGRTDEMMEIADEANPTAPSIIAERFACPVLQSPDVSDDHFFAGRMTTAVIETLADPVRNQPLFIAVGYRRPHLPFVAPQRYFDLYHPDETWLAPNPFPPVGSPVMAWFNSDGYVGGAKKFNLTMPNPPDREEAMEWNGFEMRSYQGVPKVGPIPVATQLDLLHAYAACVSYVDAQIGRLLEALEHTGTLETTTIILWSDHGWHLGEHSAWGKMTNFEVATRVPMMIAAPGLVPGRTQAIAELVDLYPTVCELMELPRPAHLEGESLVPLLTHPSTQSRTTALSQYERFGGRFIGRALRTDQHRLVLWWDKTTRQIMDRELYDHHLDPHETQNLASQPDLAPVLRRLEDQLKSAFRLPNS